jgi:hypothetical protein
VGVVAAKPGQLGEPDRGVGLVLVAAGRVSQFPTLGEPLLYLVGGDAGVDGPLGHDEQGVGGEFGSPT